MPSSAPCIALVSKSNVFPDQKSKLGELKLSVSDLPMLSCHYIQKGCLFTRSPIPIDSLVSLLKQSLSKTLSFFPPLAGRLHTDPNGYIYVTCNDGGVEFYHATCKGLSIRDVIGPLDVPEFVKKFFCFDKTVSYQGHFKPIMAVQVTELGDGVFIGCSVNHAVTDGTSFWNFFNTFAELCKKISSNNQNFEKIARQPDFSRNSVLVSPAVLKVPEGGPKVTFNEKERLRERIFSFSREAILELKARVNNNEEELLVNGNFNAVEILGKQSNDKYHNEKSKSRLFRTAPVSNTAEISSFQSLCALLWRAVTRARKLPSFQKTTFRMAVNCRHRLNPKLDPLYFGNAIQSIPTYASAGDVTSRELRWCAEQLNQSVRSHDDETVRRFVKEWEKDPRCFPLGNFDGASMTMGSSPRFPMYDNDFGWGRPLVVRSGGANKFDGKISAFPGREGNGSVDLEVVLAPETMAGIESDHEFMQYVTN
ncbi:HXXXD-type acyl-transferase family protein [Theobroma cacao]|uniref:HXXXD-type acyl-transferase family protein n=1 Tax=Theobroma cacao TaxID=3641 RepID=A0A061FTD4_THECC|nr:HXXXD-type acyl-transferase family protein [Theobroma cacao]